MKSVDLGSIIEKSVLSGMKYSIMYYCQKRVIRILTIQRCAVFATFFYLLRSKSKRIGIQNIRTTSGEYSLQNIRFEAHICQSSSKFYIQANIRLQIFAYKRILASKYSYKAFHKSQACSGNEKDPCWCRNICTLTHTGILHFSLPEISYSLWSKTFSLLLTGSSVKASKQK
jgi:hypothetical protein